jgi:hypothetical protein
MARRRQPDYLLQRRALRPWSENMGTALFVLRIAALASAVAFAGTAPAVAVPKVVPGTPVKSDIVKVGDGTRADSAKIIRRDRLHRDDGAWKKRRHVRDRRDDRRDRDDDGRDWMYRPKATQKFAYDEYGNLRIYNGDGWDRDWHDKDGRDWRKQKRKRPRIVKMNSFGYREPSPELKDVLTAVPD